MASQLWASLKMYIIQCADYVTATDSVYIIVIKVEVETLTVELTTRVVL